MCKLGGPVTAQRTRPTRTLVACSGASHAVEVKHEPFIEERAFGTRKGIIYCGILCSLVYSCHVH